MVQNLPANAGDMVQSLVQEDPTCGRATKHMHHNLLSPCPRALMPQLLKPSCLKPTLCNRRSHCNERPVHQNQRVTSAGCNYRKSMHSNKDSVWPKIVNK